MMGAITLIMGSRGNVDRSFGNGVNVTAEMEVCQIIEKIIGETVQTPQISDVLLIKVKILDIIDDLIQAGRQGKAVAARIDAVKGIENNGFVLLALEVTLHHGQFIKIGQQSQVHCTHNYNTLSFIVIMFSFPKYRFF